MQISVIASGSNGNSCLIEEKDTSILIDAGKSCKEIESRMSNLNKSLKEVDALILTHSHIDHSAGIGAISRRYDIPVYAAEEVYGFCSSRIGDVEFRKFSLDSDFKIKSLKIRPIDTSHDVPSCGFVIEKFGLFTDTGIITSQMQDAIKKVKGILLESNHDIDMLLNGRYPAFLKQRIFSNKGHLNNFDACTFVQEKGKNLDWVLLSHLSGNNNSPRIAKKTFETIVKRKIDYSVMSRDKESGTWEL